VCLEDHVHCVGHLDDFAVHETEALVVIEDCVHVFDPVSVYGAIEDDPLSGPVEVFVGTAAEQTADYSVSELLRDQVVVAIQLGQGDSFWIEHILVNRQFFE